MTVTIDLTSNANQVADMMSDFGRQLPFIASLTINRSMVDIQRQLRGVTYRKAWTNRNRALPKALTTFPNAQRAKKGKYTATMGPAMGRNGFKAGEGFVGRQMTGHTKRAKGSAIAIPQEGPGLRRLKGGSISAKKKPRANPKLFKIKKANKEFLVERQRKKLVTRYVLTPTARGTKRLSRFHADVDKTARRVIPGHFLGAVNQAIKTSR